MPRYAKLEQYTEKEREFWKHFCAMAGHKFRTFKGLEYTFTAKGNEIFFDRKRKSITCATIMQAYRKAEELIKAGRPIDGPKKLGVFGASYMYPIFLELGMPIYPTPDLQLELF